MSANYGKTTSELIGDIVKEMKKFSRENSEGMGEYIARFDNLCMKVSDMKVDLSDRYKAALMKESAGLTQIQSENINTLVDLGSDEPNLTEKMRQALRRLNITKVKEEVLMMEPECYEEYGWEQEQPEEVLYGFSGQRGGYYPQGQQQGFYPQGQQQGFA